MSERSDEERSSDEERARQRAPRAGSLYRGKIDVLAKIKALKAQMSDSVLEREDARRELDAMAKRGRDLREEIAQLKDERDHQLNRQDGKVTELRKDLDLIEAEKAQLKKELEYRITENTRLKEELSDMTERYESIKKEFEATAVRTRQLEIELDEAKEALDEINEALSH